MPLLTLFLVHQVSRVAGSIRASWSRFMPLALATLTIVSNIALFAVDLTLVKRTGFPHLPATASGNPEVWSDYDSALTWLRHNSRSDDIVASGLDTMVYLYTGRRAIRPFASRPLSLFYGEATPPTGTVDDLVSVLANYRVRYVGDLPMPGFAEYKHFRLLLDETVTTRPGCLTERHRAVGDSRFVIYEVRVERCGER
jgi:hypothetical protein